MEIDSGRPAERLVGPLDVLFSLEPIVHAVSLREVQPGASSEVIRRNDAVQLKKSP